MPITSHADEGAKLMSGKEANEKKIKSFWETVPGILTGIAALVTAIGGCVAVLVSNPRLIDLVIPSSPTPYPAVNPAPPVPSATPGSPALAAEPTNTVSPGLIATSTLSSATALSLPVELPDGPTVKMIDSTGDQYQYTILSAKRDPLPPDRYLLYLRVRAWTDFVGGMNFWSDSFRLVAGDLRLAPSNDLNELVNRDETVDGDVEFEIDGSLKDAVLIITVGGLDFSGNTKELRLIFP